MQALDIWLHGPSHDRENILTVGSCVADDAHQPVSKKGAVGSNGVSTLRVEQGCPQAHIYDPAGELTLKDVIKEITPFELQSAQASMIVSAKVDVMISSSSQKRRVERSWLVVTSVERPDQSFLLTRGCRP